MTKRGTSERHWLCRLVSVIWNYGAWIAMLPAPWPSGWNRGRLMWWWWCKWHMAWNFDLADGLVWCLGLWKYKKLNDAEIEKLFTNTEKGNTSNE